ncbi:TonB-dependent receptor, partial [Rhizobium sp. TRM95111]|uniref:tetratricopeptide repeat protein n=1 Tax=Rhizobium alarense TaxID=2846851 RepID=UPI001F1FADC8
ADPEHVETVPSGVSGPHGEFAKAYAAGFLQNIRAAIDVLKEAEKRYPDNAALPAYRAQFAFLLNDRDQTREATDRALSLDPKNPIALHARARYRGEIESDLTGAMTDLLAALEVTPGSTVTWNDLGLLYIEREDIRGAEKALKKAIELDPEGALSHANLAILYLDQGRMVEAKREIDIAFAVDPAFDIALIARGRYHLQMGDLEQAAEDLLAGTTTNPAYAQGQLLLAAAYDEKGDRLGADQAVDNADRLDPNDPVTASYRASIAIDRYDSDGAIANAQEFMRRSRLRGGDYRGLSANQDAGSTLNDAFRLQSLDAWGQYYGDLVFDPFTASGYIDQTVHGALDLVANNFLPGDSVVENAQHAGTTSSLLQGLLYDPHMISSPALTPYLLQRPFIEATLGGGFTTYNHGHGEGGSAEIQSYSHAPFPISTYFNVDWSRQPLSGDAARAGVFEGDNEILSGVGYITATPTPYNRVFAYGIRSTDDLSIRRFLPLVPTFDRHSEESVTDLAGIGGSHTFGYKNVLNAAFFFADSESDILTNDNGGVEAYSVDLVSRIGALNHTVATGPLTWRYGFEAGQIEIDQTSTGLSPFTSSVQIDYGRAYVDVLHEIRPDLKAEYALFGSYQDGEGVDVQRLEPRIGLAFEPVGGQWLRTGFMRQGQDWEIHTLSPIGLLGLQPIQTELNAEGYADTFMARWDAEWNSRLFTALDYQHQDLHGIASSYPTLWPVPYFSDSITIGEGRIDRIAATANVHLGSGFGLAGTLAYTDSENEGRNQVDNGKSLPLVPDWAGRVALTWVNEANIKATLAANYVGQRAGSLSAVHANGFVEREMLDDYWTLDANVSWEPLDKHLVFEFAAFNLLDEDFEVAAGVPGWGRSFKGTLKVRF